MAGREHGQQAQRETGLAHWERLRRALGDEDLPAALCELDALEANAARLFSSARQANKKLRLATKSLRCPGLLDRLVALGGDSFGGLMTFAAAETLHLARHGYRDLLLAYPTLHPRDCAALAEANRLSRACVAVDDEAQVLALARAGEQAGLRIPLIVDIDASYRPMESARLHLGVRRSPLREPDAIAALAERISQQAGVQFAGLMSYEAQVAGLPDRGAGAVHDAAVRAMKSRSLRQLAESRAAVLGAVRKRGIGLSIFNGGGTGSLDAAGQDPSLTELTAGSGFLASHLFAGDGNGGPVHDSEPRHGQGTRYDGLDLKPALSFAVQATRRPGPGFITCAGGGIVASGEGGRSRLPIPWLPPGLSLLAQEGAGEVQTPLRVPNGLMIPLGAPVFFRPAKAGEPLERFNELLFIRGDAIEARAKTYRGLGFSF